MKKIKNLKEKICTWFGVVYINHIKRKCIKKHYKLLSKLIKF